MLGLIFANQFCIQKYLIAPEYDIMLPCRVP